MTKRKLSRSERLRQQIEALRQAAVEAERQERDARRRTVARAAVRAGLDDLGLSFDELVAEFSAIVTRNGGTVPARAAQDDAESESAADEQQEAGGYGY